MITEEKVNVNYVNWINRLKKYNCYSEEMINAIGEKCRVASFAMTKDSGMAYEGSMIDIVMNKLCKFAFDLNKMFEEAHPDLSVNFDIVMRVLLLQHIAKCDMFEEETETYWVKKGNLYHFAKTISPLKLGERSIFICQYFGIKLSEIEYEAMRIIDKDEIKVNMYENPLAFIVRFANNAVSIEEYRKTLNN